MNTTDKKALATLGAEVQFYNQLTGCVETGIVRNVTESICEVEVQRHDGVSLVRCLWDEIVNVDRCPSCGATNEGVPPNGDAVVQVTVDRHPVTGATRALLTCNACLSSKELMEPDPVAEEPLFRDV